MMTTWWTWSRFYEGLDNVIGRKGVCSKLWSPTEFLEMQVDRDKTCNSFNTKKGMFWKLLVSKWWLFFAFCLLSSENRTKRLCYSTRVENHKEQLRGCNFCITGAFDVDSNLRLNFQEFLCTWLLRSPY